MVVHAFPAAKLAALLIKQISKPIANAVKQGAKTSPVFRKYVCLPPAQFYNWCERKSKMWLLHLGQPVNIVILNEEASIELGANLLGETVIFAIASLILIFEYNRSSKKEAMKEEARASEIQEIKDALRDLFIQTEEQGARIRELCRKMGDLETEEASKSQDIKEKSPTHKPPPQEPSLPSHPSKTSTQQNRQNLQYNDLFEKCKYQPVKGVLFTALNDVENSFLIGPPGPRHPSIVATALNHLYTNVYRSQLTF